jgi:hypothetical protein
MSQSRNQYDCCEYSHTLSQSMGPYEHVMDVARYKHAQPCRMRQGVLGGNAVSHVGASVIDVENDLRGQTRPLTQCAAFKYLPSGRGYVQGRELVKPVKHPRIFDAPRWDLRACDMIDPHNPVPKQRGSDRPLTCESRRG